MDWEKLEGILATGKIIKNFKLNFDRIFRSDSGGPLSYGPMVLGLVSFGNACDASPEKVFVRVSNYLDFIRQHS